MTDIDDEYYDDDTAPAREEPNFEDEPTEADCHGADYAAHASEAQRLMRTWNTLSPSTAAESQSLAEAQVHATLANAAATMHAAARAEESAEQVAAAARGDFWLLQAGEDHQLLGIYRSHNDACAAGVRYWQQENPEGGRPLFPWRTFGHAPSFELHAGERATGITVTRTFPGDRFGYSLEPPL